MEDLGKKLVWLEKCHFIQEVHCEKFKILRKTIHKGVFQAWVVFGKVHSKSLLSESFDSTRISKSKLTNNNNIP